jgi:hypothetical protein
MQNFRYIESIDVINFKKLVNQFADEDWDVFDFRQKTYEVHKETKTIPLIFDEDFRVDNPTYLEHYKKFEAELNAIKNIFTDKLGAGFIIRAILVNLKANYCIDRHVDKGVSLEVCNRVHIPIITNDKVIFEVGGEERYLKEGELWEINNSQKLHSVANNSDVDRVHLIVDWIKT